MAASTVTHYREFAPCEELREYVRAFFSFAPESGEPAARRQLLFQARFGKGDPFCSPLFADAHSSLVFSLGTVCRADGSWHRSSSEAEGKLIGPMTRVDPAFAGDLPALVGVYIRAGQSAVVAHAPAAELTDKIVRLCDLWGGAAAGLASDFDGMSEAARIDRLEAILLRRVHVRLRSGSSFDVPRLAAWIRERRGQVSVETLAHTAGVSRQHLTRVFQASVGVTPKLYCRLARFRSALAYAGRGADVDWARAAAEAGYSDQSHMIAEFREFSSLTPQRLAAERWFHPFIERARARKQGARWLEPPAYGTLKERGDTAAAR